jgi:4'-phosphopantetheinyl transferase
MMWVDGIAGWDGQLPAVLISTGKAAKQQRRDLLHALVARFLELDPSTVVIEQTAGRPPTVKKPSGSDVYLSLSWRSPYTAAAIAASPVGVDVELVDEKGEVPWNVLHASEKATLGSLPENALASAFARLWSLKEAYLKALGIGLAREPSSFSVQFADEERAIIHDPSMPAIVIDARTTWRQTDAIPAAVSAILLKRSPS